QAEDGIRDLTVTGVQTCALPISLHNVERVILHRACPQPDTGRNSDVFRIGRINGNGSDDEPRTSRHLQAIVDGNPRFSAIRTARSEERRVGKECRSWWWPAG